MSNWHIIFKQAKKDILDYGRPSNGMFMAIPNEYSSSICDVSPENWRLQAATLKTSRSQILVINSYFPTDSGIRYNNAELEELFVAIENIIGNNEFSSLIWAGDINADFLRNTGHVQAVKHFVSRLCLHSAWTKFEIDFTHTSEINGHTYCSTLDHFFWSENLSDAVIDAGVIHMV